MAPQDVSHLSFEYLLKASSAIPVESSSEAREYIENFLHGPREENLLLKVSWDILSKETRQMLDRASGENMCRWEHDPDYEILKVKGMGSPLRAAFHASIFTSSMAYTTTFTQDECQCIMPVPWRTILFSTRNIDEGDNAQNTRGVKRRVWTKHPDSMIYFYAPESDAIVNQIVIEIGFSESYHDLVRDALQWLLGSGGEPKLVIIVKIEEDKSHLDAYQKTQHFMSTRDQLIAKYGDEKSHDTYKIKCAINELPDSTPKLYRQVKTEIVASDWVGPLSAYIELWELKDGQPVLREPRFDVLPVPENPRSLVLRITDLIPEDRHVVFPNFDPSRTITVDMERIRCDMRIMKKRTAFHRAIRMIRPSDGDEDDSQFLA